MMSSIKVQMAVKALSIALPYLKELAESTDSKIDDKIVELLTRVIVDDDHRAAKGSCYTVSKYSVLCDVCDALEKQELERCHGCNGHETCVRQQSNSDQ